MEDTTSLFNYRDPRSLMADRYASQYMAPSGSLENMIVQTGANAGSLVGNALFGGRTSEMAEQMVLNEAIKESEAAEDPDERLSLFAKALRKRGLEGYAQQAESQLVQRKKTRAEADKASAAAQLEANLRAELQALPEGATPEEIEAVVFKYGDPDKILTTLERRQARVQATEDRIAAARQAQEDRLALARENNASREQIAAMNRQFQQQLLAMRQDDKQQAARDKQANKTLPASLQVKEDEDNAAIDTAQAAVEDISPILSTLKNGQLNLSGFNNIMFKAKAAIGSDDPEVLQYQALQRQLTRFINSTLQLNKGVQTEGDAQRAANELNAAFSANNSKAMTAALEEMVKVNKRAVTNRQNSINRRRKSQGVSPVSGGSILDAADAIINGN